MIEKKYLMQFRYWLRYQPKISVNLGFGIGPKPKQWFRSYTIRTYLVSLEVLRGQQIKLIHAVSNEDFHDYYDHDQRNQTQLHKVNDLISVLYHTASTSQTLETSPQDTQNHSVSKETIDLTGTRGVLWFDKVY